jgi:simple sugar transport system ATP-binding protein
MVQPTATASPSGAGLATESERAPIVELRDASKSFGRVYALQSIDLRLYPGEVVSLVGDNGAGKSTLTKLIAGVHAPDPGGEILVRGSRVDGWNTRRAREAGIETVYQTRALAEQQSVAENVFLGRERVNRLGFVRRREQVRETERLMRSIGYTSKVWTPESPVSRLSGGERQGVAIARALYFEAQVIMLDEPTSAMALSETEEVLQFVRRARAEGRAVLFISHDMYDAHGVADRFVILDRGRIAADRPKGDMTVEDLIQALHRASREGAER